MPLNGGFPNRRSIRLEGYDYTQAGAYFITLVTAGRTEKFGVIRDGEMQLNDAGQMAWRQWQRLPVRFPGVDVDAFIVMPNHFHGIIMLCPTNDGAAPHPDKEIAAPYVFPGSLGAIVRAYKSSTTLLYRRMRGSGLDALWQRNYYEHILRTSATLDETRAYIINNPLLWEKDQENPDMKTRHDPE